MKIDSKPIQAVVETFHYIKIEKELKTFFTRKVVGWGVKKLPYLSPELAASRLRKDIAKNQLPLIVQDSTDPKFDYKLLFKV